MTLEQDIQNNPTVFGKILRGEIPSDKVYEDDKILAFKDILPKAKVHILIIPKKLIPSLADATAEDAETLGHLMAKIPEIAKKVGVQETGFRLISNAKEHGGQEVPHLHYHLLGGEQMPKF